MVAGTGLDVAIKEGVTGLLLNTADIPGMRRAWSGGWAGLCNTRCTTNFEVALYASL